MVRGRAMANVRAEACRAVATFRFPYLPIDLPISRKPAALKLMEVSL